MFHGRHGTYPGGKKRQKGIKPRNRSSQRPAQKVVKRKKKEKEIAPKGRVGKKKREDCCQCRTMSSSPLCAMSLFLTLARFVLVRVRMARESEREEEKERSALPAESGVQHLRAMSSGLLLIWNRTQVPVRGQSTRVCVRGGLGVTMMMTMMVAFLRDGDWSRGTTHAYSISKSAGEEEFGGGCLSKVPGSYKGRGKRAKYGRSAYLPFFVQHTKYSSLRWNRQCGEGDCFFFFLSRLLRSILYRGPSLAQPVG